MSLKKKCDIYYVRNLISLIHCVGILKQIKNSNYKILFLNYYWINKKTFIFFKNFFKIYFDEIVTFNFSSKNLYNNVSSKKFNSVEKIFIRRQELNKFSKKIIIDLKKFNIRNIFSGGDDFHLLFKNYNKIYFVEHGVGNYRDCLIFNKKKIITIINFFLKYLNYFFSNFIYLKKYDGYLSLLSNKIKLKPIINNYKTAYINSKKKYMLSTLNDMSYYIKKNIDLPNFTQKKKIFINLTGLKYIDESENNKIIEKIISNIDNNEIIILKDHPRYVALDNRIKKNLLKKLKKNKIKFYIIKKGILKNIPLELFIYLVSSNKIISAWSSVSFFCAILFDDLKFKNIMLSDYCMKYPYDDESKRNKIFFSIIKKKFRNIKFL